MPAWFSKLFQPTRQLQDGYTQAQREALIDLLNLCMCADGRLHLSEERILDARLANFEWESAVSVPEYTASSLERARAAVGSDAARHSLLASIDSRLERADMKSNAIQLCRHLFVSDGDFAPSEHVVFNELITTFGWADRAAGGPASE